MMVECCCLRSSCPMCGPRGDRKRIKELTQQLKEAEAVAYERGKADELKRIVAWAKEFHESGWDCEELIEHIQEWKK